MILCFLPLKICSKQKSDNTFPDEFANTMAVPCIKCNAAVSFLRATFSSRYIAKWYNVFKKKSFCFKKKKTLCCLKVIIIAHRIPVAVQTKTKQQPWWNSNVKISSREGKISALKTRVKCIAMSERERCIKCTILLSSEWTNRKERKSIEREKNSEVNVYTYFVPLASSNENIATEIVYVTFGLVLSFGLLCSFSLVLGICSLHSSQSAMYFFFPFLQCIWSFHHWTSAFFFAHHLFTRLVCSNQLEKNLIPLSNCVHCVLVFSSFTFAFIWLSEHFIWIMFVRNLWVQCSIFFCCPLQSGSIIAITVTKCVIEGRRKERPTHDQCCSVIFFLLCFVSRRSRFYHKSDFQIGRCFLPLFPFLYIFF